MPNVKMEGRAAAVRAFKALPDTAQVRLGAAVEKTAYAIIQRARALVRVRTGALKSKLNYSFSQKTGIASAGIEKGAVGKEVPGKIGHLVEFGHGGPHPAPAYPFMLPSAEAERQPFLERCHDAGKAIERDLTSGGGLL